MCYLGFKFFIFTIYCREVVGTIFDMVLFADRMAGEKKARLICKQNQTGIKNIKY